MKVLIADDHIMQREAIRLALESVYLDVSIIESACYEQTISQLKNNPDYAIVDIRMPNTKGLLSIERYVSESPNTVFIVCSALSNTIVQQTVLSLGADYFISKKGHLKDIIDIIGESRLRKFKRKALTSEAKNKFTKRQCEIIELICLGLPNKIISRKLEISGRTVKFHLKEIFDISGVSNRQELICMMTQG